MRSRETIEEFNQSFFFQILRISARYTWYVIFDASIQEVKFLKFSGWFIICFFQNILDIFLFNFSICNLRLFDLDKRLNISCAHIFIKYFLPILDFHFAKYFANLYISTPPSPQISYLFTRAK